MWRHLLTSTGSLTHCLAVSSAPPCATWESTRSRVLAPARTCARLKLRVKSLSFCFRKYKIKQNYEWLRNYVYLELAALFVLVSQKQLNYSDIHVWVSNISHRGMTLMVSLVRLFSVMLLFVQTSILFSSRSFIQVLVNGFCRHSSSQLYMWRHRRCWQTLGQRRSDSRGKVQWRHDVFVPVPAAQWLRHDSVAHVRRLQALWRQQQTNWPNSDVRRIVTAIWIYLRWCVFILHNRTSAWLWTNSIHLVTR